jgi:hypothetical protein
MPSRKFFLTYIGETPQIFRASKREAQQQLGDCRVPWLATVAPVWASAKRRQPWVQKSWQATRGPQPP